MAKRSDKMERKGKLLKKATPRRMTEEAALPGEFYREEIERRS